MKSSNHTSPLPRFLADHARGKKQNRSGSQREPLPFLTHTAVFSSRAVLDTLGKAGISARRTSCQQLAKRLDRAPEHPANQKRQSVFSWGITSSSVDLRPFSGPSLQLRETANATPAVAHLKSLGQPLTVSLQPLIGAQRVLVMFPKRGNGGGLARFNAVINPLPFPSRCHESGLPDQLQVVGQSGLAHLQRIRQLADTHIARAQSGDNPHARWVGQGFGKQNQVVHSRFLISGDEDMFSSFISSRQGRRLPLIS